MPEKISYKIYKVLNNNVILALDLSSNQELILVGKGIGFGHKANEVIELTPEEIEKSFVAYDEKTKKQYYQIINELNSEVMGLSEEIIALAEKELGDLNPHIHIALTDHIGFALDRLKEGMEVNNPFLEEIRILYSGEYKIGIKAAKMIKERLEIEIPDSEIGFIAMHLHAARQNKKISKTVKYTSLLKELMELIENELNIKVDPSDLGYIRLINHLRFSIDRMENGEVIENPLLNKIKEEFRDSYKLAGKIGAHIEARLKLFVSEDELGYIALHLHRLRDSKIK